jgi:hypothetical protein
MARDIEFIWDLADDPEGNVHHIAEHDLTVDEVEDVVVNPTSTGNSRSSGLPCVWGYTATGRYIIVVFEELDVDVVCVVTAYEVEE